MSVLNYFIFIFLIYSNDVSSLQKFACDIIDNLPVDKNEEMRIDNGTITIEYDRDYLGVYKQNDPNALGILLNKVDVKFKGKLLYKSNPETVQVEAFLSTVIGGTGILRENDTLYDCDLEVSSNIKYSDDLSLLLQDRIFYLAKPCIETKLCKRVGTIESEDHSRDFSGSHKLLEKYHNLFLPQKSQNNESSDTDTLQVSLDMISDFVIAEVIHFVSGNELGYIDLPNLHQVIPRGLFHSGGYIDLSNGKLWDLKNIFRNSDLEVTTNGFHFTLRIGIEVPKPTIYFENFELHHPFADKTGNLTISAEKFTFIMRIDVNYNLSPCAISVNIDKSKLVGVNFDLPCCLNFDYVLNKAIRVALNLFTPLIVDYVNLRLKEAISVPLDKLNCEHYRP